MEGLVISYQMVGLIVEQLLDTIILGRRGISGAHKVEADYHDLLMVMLYIALYIVMRLTM